MANFGIDDITGRLQSFKKCVRYCNSWCSIAYKGNGRRTYSNFSAMLKDIRLVWARFCSSRQWPLSDTRMRQR